MKLQTLALLAATGLALVACGDSPTAELPGTPPATQTVPASAQASTLAWTGYTAALPASDSADPVDVNTATPPTSDTEEPQPV